MFRTSIGHYYKSMKKQKSPATTSAGICATPSSLHNMVWSSMWPQTQPGTVADPGSLQGLPRDICHRGSWGAQMGVAPGPHRLDTSRAHPQQQRFSIASSDMQPTPARGRGEEARRSRKVEAVTMQVRLEEDLVTPFSHALHLFRPDPQRSICIGKRNHETRWRRRLGRGGRPARLLRGRQEGLRKRGGGPVAVSLSLTWSCSRSGPGQPARRAEPESTEESRPLSAGLCRFRPTRPLYARPRPWRPAHRAAAVTCGCRLRRPRPCPPPRLRDRGTKTCSELSADLRPTGGRPKAHGAGGCWQGPGTGPALASTYLPTCNCLRQSLKMHTGLSLPAPSCGQQHLQPPAPLLGAQSPRNPTTPTSLPRGSGGELSGAIHT